MTTMQETQVASTTLQTSFDTISFVESFICSISSLPIYRFWMKASFGKFEQSLG